MVLFTDIFKLESDPQGTAIKATDNERYLSIHIDGEGVPDFNPTFTASNSSGSSTATIKVRGIFGAKQCSTQIARPFYISSQGIFSYTHQI